MSPPPAMVAASASRRLQGAVVLGPVKRREQSQEHHQAAEGSRASQATEFGSSCWTGQRWHPQAMLRVAHAI
eukprot:9056874-Pyramimonas_sp.AAC.1